MWNYQKNSEAAGRILQRSLSAASLVLTGLTIVAVAVLPPYPIRYDLDGSWVSFLSLAASRDWQAGSDYVFTYGPLGSWLWPVGVDSTLLWSSLLRAASALCVAVHIWSRSGHFRATVLSVCVIYIAFQPNIDLNGPIFAVSLVAAFSFVERRPLMLFTSVGLLTLWGLVKFSGVVLLGTTIGWCLVLTLACQPGNWREHLANAAVSALAAVAVLGGVYLGYLNHPISAFFEYAGWSTEISRGYTQWMSIGSRHAYLFGFFGAVAIVGLIHLLILLAASPQEAGSRHRGRRLLGAFRAAAPALLCILPILFVAFKQGFVRQDGHEAAAYVVAFIYAAFVTASAPLKDRLIVPASAALSAICLSFTLAIPPQSPGFLRQVAALPESTAWIYRQMVENVGLALPGGLEAMRKAVDRRTERAVDDLHKTASILSGLRSYDIFSHEQGAAWANVAGYRPRPVFQGYSAYTAALQDLNAAHTGTVPDAVLVGMAALDGRFPNLEDGSALGQIMLNYCPTDAAGSRVLFRRQTGGLGENAIDEWDWRAQRLDAAGGRLELPSGVVFGTVDIELSFWGRLLAAAYRLPPLKVQLELRDGERRVARLIPTGQEFPAILSPLLTSAGEVMALAVGSPSMPAGNRQIEAISLIAGDYILSLLDRVTVAYASPPESSISGACDAPVVHSSPWGTVPVALSRGVLGTARGVDAHPKRALAVRIDGADYLKASLRLREVKFARPRSDGVEVQIRYVQDGTPRSLLSHRVATSQLDKKGRLVVFEGPIDLGDGYLILETDDVNRSWDWYVWDEIVVR